MSEKISVRRGPQSASRVSQILELDVGEGQIFLSRQFDIDETCRKHLRDWTLDSRNSLSSAVARAYQSTTYAGQVYTIDAVSAVDQQYNIIVSFMITRTS